MDSNAPPILKATVIGGVAAGVASALPFLELLNILCCALVVAGGFLAGFLYSRDCVSRGHPFGAANGVTAGLVAAPFFAVSEFAGLVVREVTGLRPDIEPVLEQMQEQLDNPDIPQRMAEVVLWFYESLLTPTLLHFLFMLIIAAIFSTLGGLIAGVSFKFEPAPPAGGKMPPPPTMPSAGPEEPGPPPPPQE